MTKKGFTLVELVVIAPLVVLLVGGLVSAILFTTTRGLHSQARTQLQLDVLTAIDRIEQDVRLSIGVNSSSTSVINIENLATSRNPLDPNRQLVRESTCSVVSDGLAVEDALRYTTRYRRVGSTYVRSVTLDSCATSNNVWQNNVEEVLIRDATVTAVIQYVSNNTMRVELTASRQVGRDTLSYTGRLYVRSLNI